MFEIELKFKIIGREALFNGFVHGLKSYDDQSSGCNKLPKGLCLPCNYFCTDLEAQRAIVLAFAPALVPVNRLPHGYLERPNSNLIRKSKGDCPQYLNRGWL